MSADRNRSLLTEVRADIAANLEREPSTFDVLAALLWSRGVQAVVLYRVARRLHTLGLRPLAELLLRISQMVFSVDLHYTAEAASGLVLRHPANIVVGRGATLGRRVVLFQGTTLGNRMSGGPERPDGMPT